MSGVCREDGGERERREAEGEEGLAGQRKVRGREPAWRACALLGNGEEEERAGGSFRRGRSGARCPRPPGRLAPAGKERIKMSFAP